ncbi:hypothetical protein RJT34_21605 [Clitoria ternatea]|uniref:Uncharacterized protein n=1 Tax=Clitoria ternatea TaxID=43366 RepID=A0AAN9IUD9_CLITE
MAAARDIEALQLYDILVRESFSAAIRQIQYWNPGVNLNLNEIHPYYEFHGGKLFSVVERDPKELEDMPYELVALPKP